MVNLEELPQHFLHLDRKTIIMEKNLNDSMAKEFKYQIAPSPKFSSHPNFGEKIKKIPRSGENTLEILSELQLEGKNIEEYYKSLSLEVPKL